MIWNNTVDSERLLATKTPTVYKQSKTLIELLQKVIIRKLGQKLRGILISLGKFSPISSCMRITAVCLCDVF